MTTEILKENRTPTKTVLLEHRIGLAVEFAPAFAVLVKEWYRTEEEAAEAYENAVKSRQTSQKRTDSQSKAQTQRQRKTQQNAL